jgi:hypothetical protein
MKFEIKNRFSGTLLFSIETETWKLAVEAAVKASANLRSADLSYADLSSANLSSADLRSANLSYADLSSANLGSADLRSADLGSADLSSADLSSADLRYADLRSADLSSADLCYANLRYANLSSADLSSANLGSADLRSADLSSANLRSADLSYADLRSAKGINKYRSTPLLMLLDQPGKIRAYKLVNENFEGPFNGGIKYIGKKKIKVDDANTSDTEQCAAGINLATLDWCMAGWRPGYHILVAEFEAKDIAAIPIATDGKFRVRQCVIVGEKDLKEIGLVTEPKTEKEAKS